VTRWVSVGRVGRPHGLDGSFVVEEASTDPARFAVGAQVYIGREPVEVVASKRAGGRPVIKLACPAERGSVLEIPESELPPPGEDEYYAFQLVGLAVEEEGGRRLGTVVEVMPGMANDVLELDSGHSLPLVAECIREVDLSGRRIVIAPGFGESI
jgi:16S rRNA processing protein RimM